MNLDAVITMKFGGQGSGCNPRVGKCGRPSTGKTADDNTSQVATTQQVVSWLKKKGLNLNSTGEERVANSLRNLGVSEAVMKLPLNGIELGQLKQDTPGAMVVGGYAPDENVLRLDPHEATLNTLPHELTHWALFIQAPEINSHDTFPVDTPMPEFSGRPGLKQDLDAAVAEYHAAADKAAREVGEKRFDWKSQINEYMDMPDKQARAAGAPSGYALAHPAEWISEVAAINVAKGNMTDQPAAAKLVRNLWGGKYIANRH